MRLLRVPMFYHPAYCRHETVQEHHFFIRPKLQEKYWLVHHPQAGCTIGKTRNTICNKESVQEIYNSRLKRFEKKAKLMTKLQNYYGIFLHSVPPFRPHNKNVQINHIQVSCPPSRSNLTTAVSSITNKSSLSNISVTKESRVGKKKNKRRKLALSHTFEQLTTNQFFGDKKIIKIENINTRFADSAQNVLQPPLGQMGDFCEATDSTNVLFELRPQQQQQYDLNTSAESLLFTPVCTSVICSDQNKLLNMRFSGIDTESAKVKMSLSAKEQKLKRAKQLHIVQQKLQQDQHRETLEFNPQLDSDWLVICRELCDYKGKMTTLKRTIQYIHDDEIIIEQSLERSFKHRKLKDSAQDISEFVKSLNQLHNNDNKPIVQAQSIQSPSSPAAQIHHQRIAELCHPDTILANKIRNYNRMNSFKIPANTKPKAIAAGNLTDKVSQENTSPASKIDDLWFARNYNCCYSLDKSNKINSKVNNLSMPPKRIQRFLQRHYRHFQRFLRSHSNERESRNQNFRENTAYLPKVSRNLVII